MNPDPATELHPAMSKRTRFNDDSSQPSTSQKNGSSLRSPKEAAYSFTHGTFASLNPKLATILTNTSETHLNLLHRIFEKRRQLVRMTTDLTFIPSSARVKDFEFYVRKTVENSADFKAIQEETREGVQKYRLFLKTQILKVMSLDISSQEEEINNDYVRSLDIVLRGHLISIDRSPDERHRYITDIFKENHETLLSHTTMDYADFCDRYQNIYALEKFPLEDVPRPEVNPNISHHFGGNQNTGILQYQQETLAIRDTCVPIFALLQSVFTTPYVRYIETVTQNELNLNLSKLSTEYSLEKATVDTSMMIDTEDSADKTQLRELIQQESRVINKKLHEEIAALKRLIPATGVKGNRGPKKSGGSSTIRNQKPKDPPSSSSSQKNKSKAQRGQKAGERGKDSRSANNQKKKKKGPRDSQRRPKPSTTARK